MYVVNPIYLQAERPCCYSVHVTVLSLVSARCSCNLVSTTVRLWTSIVPSQIANVTIVLIFGSIEDLSRPCNSLLSCLHNRTNRQCVPSSKTKTPLHMQPKRTIQRPAMQWNHHWNEKLFETLSRFVAIRASVPMWRDALLYNVSVLIQGRKWDGRPHHGLE